jgi:hypothetical protein
MPLESPPRVLIESTGRESAGGRAESSARCTNRDLRRGALSSPLTRRRNPGGPRPKALKRRETLKRRSEIVGGAEKATSPSALKAGTEPVNFNISFRKGIAHLWRGEQSRGPARPIGGGRGGTTRGKPESRQGLVRHEGRPAERGRG